MKLYCINLSIDFFFFLKMDNAFIKTKKENTTKQRPAVAEPNRKQLRQHPNELTMKGKEGLHPTKAGKNFSCEHNESIHEPLD